MGQTLQAPLHVEASAQTAMGSAREPELGFSGPQAVTVGGFAPLPHGLSRASRTRSVSFTFASVAMKTRVLLVAFCSASDVDSTSIYATRVDE